MSIQQDLIDNYEKSIVKIIINDGRAFGTGFIVTEDGIICTCYHVVGDLGSKTISDDIKVHFPSGLTLTAHVLRNENDQEYADPINDIAFLQISPEGQSQLESRIKKQILFVAPLSTSKKYIDHRFIAKGYRKIYEFPHGLGSNGTILFSGTHVVAEYNEEIDIVQLHAENIEKGMSGSPVFDIETNNVIGMITRIYDKQEDRDRNLVMAIPINSLVRVYSELSKKNPRLSEDVIIKNLSPMFKASKHFLDEFEKMLDEAQHQQALSKARGLISLIILGSTFCRQITDKGQTLEQRAFSNLLTAIFDSAKETIEDSFWCRKILNRECEYVNTLTSEDLSKKLENNKKTIKEKFLEPFRKDIKCNPYLPDNESVDAFRKSIIFYLKDQNLEITDINRFVAKFNLLLDSKANNDDILKNNFYSWWTKKQQVKNLVEHLEEIRADQNFVVEWDRMSLQDYYVPHRALLTEMSNWVDTPDEDFDNSNSFNEDDKKDPIEIIKKDLLSNDVDWDYYRYIGGTFGIGKTTLCRIIASNFAREYLQNPNPENNYIPIYGHLTSKIDTKSKYGSIEDILRIIYPLDSPQYKNRKVLLILDALEEYRHNLDELKNALKKFHSDYSNNIKVIITMRTDEPDRTKITQIRKDESAAHNNKFIRLLAFKPEQVNDFFKKYKVIDKIEYDYVINRLHWNDLQIKKPFFAWILALIYGDPQETIKKNENLDDNKNLDEKTSRTLIFFHFIHNFIRKKEYEGEIYHKEKQILRVIAALKHIHENNLVEAKVEDKDSRINLDDAISKFDTFKDIDNFREIYKSYLSPPIDNDKTVNFVHQTIGEYLLAEYYIDNLLWSRTHRLNVGKPSESTIDFLDGLLNLLKQDLEKEGINKIFNEFVGPYQLHNRRAHLKEIAKNALNSIVKDNVIFLELNKSDPGVSPDVMWTSVNSKHKNYKYQWIHKWIASFILNNMINDKSPIIDEQEKKTSEIKEKLVELIRFSDRLGIPNYLKKLNNFDLSDANLIETNLSAADFSNNKELQCANFFYAKLTYANFSNSNLSLANFWRANLKNINFHNACLSGANLYLVEIRRSNLEAADLTYAELYGANLARSNLSNANLSGANLSNADLSGATMDVKQYDGLKCYNANNVDNIKTKDHKLLDYLMKESKKSPASRKAGINKGSSVSLTGKWRSNDGGTYYVNKIGNTVWFLGLSNALNFANVFKGNITNNGIIEGEWTDVPLGEDMDYGKLNLMIESEGDKTIMLKMNETGGFGATIWKSVNSLSLKNESKLYNRMTPSYIKNENGRDLTGIWTLKNGDRTHYVHQIENTNTVWSLGIDKEHNFARVFRGEINNEYTIIGEWADVDRKDNGELTHGKIRLNVNKSGQEAVLFQEDNLPELTFRRLV